MKKIILPFLLISFLSGCESHEQTVQCGDYNVVINFSEDGTIMHAVINGVPTDLYLVQSASGAKYDGVFNGQNLTMWSKGELWTAFINEGVAMGCE